MLYFFRLLVLLINIDQETFLNWFDIENPNNNLSTALSMSFKELWIRVTEGLTLADIENLLFFILFIRFVILAIRYNLKTSFYIICIGLFAGYLWYRHLLDLIAMYRSILIKLPYLHKLGIDAIQLRSLNQQLILTDSNLENSVHWYNPGQLIYYAIIKGIIKTNPETGLRYYIDPISMLIANLKESEQSKIIPIYYQIYNKVIPQISAGVSKFWTQLSGIAAYSFITRIGKRYCPYLVRWHWTFLLIIGFIEQILIYFCYRISYFQSNILVPQTKFGTNFLDERLVTQINLLNGLLTFIVCFHIGLICLGLFHAIWGQYFYFPFLVENTELHVGSRPTNSIYSGGSTAWQDQKEKQLHSYFPKLWYGWFGKGTLNNKNIFYQVRNLIKNILKRLRN